MLAEHNAPRCNVCDLRQQSHDGEGCQRFSAAGLAHNRQDFAFIDLKADSIHHRLACNMNDKLIDYKHRVCHSASVRTAAHGW